MSNRSDEHSAGSEAVLAPPAQEPEYGVSPAEIAEAAYRRWVERGCPQGSAEEDWLEAEKELMVRKPSRASAG